MDNLRYIRETMERSTYLTGISGRGEMAIGCTALLACMIAAQHQFQSRVFRLGAEGRVSVGSRLAMDRKARRGGCVVPARTQSRR